MQQLLFSEKQFCLTLNRLCFELIENYESFESTVIIGIQPRGALLSEYIKQKLLEINPTSHFKYGVLDITFFRDDIHQHNLPILPSPSQINFEIENMNVVLIDDVLYTGRTIRAAIDAILSFGRPKKIELMVLIDRLYSRQLPIQSNYVGCLVDTLQSEKIKLEWNSETKLAKVWLYNNHI